MPHDVFISHSTKDRDTAALMCKELEASGYHCWIAPRDIAGGEAWDEAIVRGIDNSRMVLLLFSEVSNESPHVKKEIMRAMEKCKPLLPVRISDIEPGPSLVYILTGIQRFDAFASPVESYIAELKTQVAGILSSPAVKKQSESPASLAEPVARTVEAASVTLPKSTAATPVAETNKPRVALLYKRSVQPDGYVLQMLEKTFLDAGYDVFIDRHMQIGVEWAHEIERNIRIADAVVPILSEAAANSEMIGYEIEIARSAAQSQHGKPRLLPVRVGYEGTLGEQMDAALKPLQYALWKSQADDEAVKKRLFDAMRQKDEAVPEQMRGPLNGAIPINSPFYMPRASDDALSQALNRKDTIVLVKGGRQMGKTSLVARGLKQAEKSGATVIYTDLQKMNTSDLTTIQQFYFSLAHMLADRVQADKDIDDTWKERRAPSVNFEQYLRNYIMPKASGHVYWAVDEADRLFTTEFGSEVFGLFRCWHNERAIDPETPWSNLTLIISYATEAHLFIADPNQSPFNVGTRLELRDFNLEQEEALNKLYGSPLFSDDQVAHFNDLVNGQPYLTGRGLYDLATTKMPFEEFAATADRDEGPFGDHLRRILVMLCRDPKMVEAIKIVLAGGDNLPVESFYRLRAAGIIVGDGPFNMKMRCSLYANYLRGHLRETA